MHGANGTAAIQSELQPCGNRTMKPHELTILGHTHTQKLAHSIMTFSRIHMQDLHTLLRNKTALKNPYRPYPARVLVELRGFEPLTSTMRMLRATICAIAPYIFLGTFGLEVSCHGTSSVDPLRLGGFFALFLIFMTGLRCIYPAIIALSMIFFIVLNKCLSVL